MQVAFNPRVLLPLSHIGEQHEFRVQDASSFAAIGESLSYWDLLVRAWPPQASSTGGLVPLAQRKLVY